MTENTIELTRRRILLTLVVTGLVMAGAGAGTMSLLSDSEHSINSFQAGTLDLKIGGDDNATALLNVSNQKPGAGGQANVTLTNAGSIDGSLDVNVTNVTNHEHATPDSENETAPPGDLGNNSEVVLYLDDDGNLSTTDDQTRVANGTINQIAGQEYDVNHTLAANQTTYLVVEWQIPRSVGNQIQGDDFHLDIWVELNQRDSQ